MYAINDRGGIWMGVRASTVRGRLEIKVVGLLCLSTAGTIGDEAVRPPGSIAVPILVDMSEISITDDLAMAMSVALAGIMAVAGEAPVAVVSVHAERAVSRLRAMDSRVMSFVKADAARRWLRRQMVS